MPNLQIRTQLLRSYMPKVVSQWLCLSTSLLFCPVRQRLFSFKHRDFGPVPLYRAQTSTDVGGAAQNELVTGPKHDGA